MNLETTSRQVHVKRQDHTDGARPQTTAEGTIPSTRRSGASSTQPYSPIDLHLYWRSSLEHLAEICTIDPSSSPRPHFQASVLLHPFSGYEERGRSTPNPTSLHTPTRFLGFDRHVAFKMIFAFALASLSRSSPGHCLNAREFVGRARVLAFVASCHGWQRVRSARCDSSCIKRRAVSLRRTL